jgi:hypothetical protein
MPALVAGIHAYQAAPVENMDGRDRPGHDDGALLMRQVTSTYKPLPSNAIA